MTVKILELKKYAPDPEEGGAERLQEAKLEVGQGIAGSRLKHPERQVSILTKEARAWMDQQEEKGLCFAKCKENMLLEGSFERGSKLAFGEAVLQVGFDEKYCFPSCVYRQGASPCPLAGGMFFAKVLESGTVKTGERGYALSPRYGRNLHALSVREAAELHSKKVCVIGAGGLGGYVVEQLARIGVLQITLVDYDVFEASNLNRQLFSTEPLLGVAKVEAAARRIGEVNARVRIREIQEKFAEDNALDLVKGHDVAIDALDNIQTRFLLARTCKTLGIPMVHGSIAGWFGQVCSVFPEDDTLERIYRDAKGEKGGEVRLGNLPFTAAVIASMQCAECIKILTGRPDVVRNAVLQVDLLYGECYRLVF